MAEVKLAKVERYGLESVPVQQRTTTGLEYMMIQIAVSVNAGNFLVPALAVLHGGLSFSYAVISTVIGAACAFFFVSCLALPGARHGIPAQYAIRSILGIKGTRFVSSPVRTLTSLYWFSVQTIGGTYLLKEMIERIFHITVPFVALALSLAFLMAVLALIGFDAVKRITKYFLPFLFVGGLVMLWVMITNSPQQDFQHNLVVSNHLGTMLFYASLAFVQYVSGVSASSDMARYAKSTHAGFYGLFFGNVLGFMMTAILGAYAAAIAGSWNPYVVASQMTDSAVFLILIIVAAFASMIMINLSNAYTGGFSLLNSIPSLGRVKSSIIFGIIAITLSAFPTLVENAQVYISYLGALVIPLSAIIVTDFLFVKRRELAIREFSYNAFGLCCAGFGIVLYLLIPVNASPGFLTFIVISCLYYVGCRFIQKQR